MSDERGGGGVEVHPAAPSRAESHPFQTQWMCDTSAYA